MRALRDMNLPKFVFEDVPLFLGLISDLFPQLSCPRVRYPNFNDTVEQILQENKYIVLPDQVSPLFHLPVLYVYTHTQRLLLIISFSCGFTGVRWTRWCSCTRQ